jgi:hypothetical protein
MDYIFIHNKDELCSQVHKQIEKAKAVISQSRKTVEQAKQQAERLRKEYDIYLSTLNKY